MKLKRAKTKILCNQCPNLKIVERKITEGKRIDRRTWVLYCKDPEGDIFIDVVDTLNRDIKNKEIPLIIAPFGCRRRQEERLSNNEMKFELQIS